MPLSREKAFNDEARRADATINSASNLKKATETRATILYARGYYEFTIVIRNHRSSKMTSLSEVFHNTQLIKKKIRLRACSYNNSNNINGKCYLGEMTKY